MVLSANNSVGSLSRDAGGVGMISALGVLQPIQTMQSRQKIGDKRIVNGNGCTAMLVLTFGAWDGVFAISRLPFAHIEIGVLHGRKRCFYRSPVFVGTGRKGCFVNHCIKQRVFAYEQKGKDVGAARW